MKRFLLGVLAGLLLAIVVSTVTAAYIDLHLRLSRVEGYLHTLDQLLRAAS